MSFRRCEKPSQFHGNRKQDRGCQGLGEGEGAGEVVFNGYRGSVWEDEKALGVDGMVVMSAQQYECT